jgi:hypothetical protein
MSIRMDRKTPPHRIEARLPTEFTPYNKAGVNVSVAIQNQCGAQTTQPPYGDEARPMIQASFSHVEATPSGRPYAESRWSLLRPRYLLPASAQLLGFCLLSALEIIVRLQEEKPSTLPVADRTCLL